MRPPSSDVILQASTRMSGWVVHGGRSLQKQTEALNPNLRSGSDPGVRRRVADDGGCTISAYRSEAGSSSRDEQALQEHSLSGPLLRVETFQELERCRMRLEDVRLPSPARGLGCVPFLRGAEVTYNRLL